MKRQTLYVSSLIAAGLLAGCAGSQTSEPEARESAPLVTKKPAAPAAPVETPPAKEIRRQLPSPLPIVRLVPGEEKRISLVGAAGSLEFNVKSATEETPIGCAYILEPDAVVVRANPGANGVTLVAVRGEIEDGSEEIIFFPVQVEPLPIVSFVYTPKAGESVEQVSAAGSFNGWSNSSDPLVKGADGVFRLDKAIAPGSHTYKFVVDGDWIADPSNPETDSTGYGNSLLKVEGEVAAKFQFRYLGSGKQGAGTLGALEALLPEGDSLTKDGILVLRNNQKVSAESWSITDDRFITLNGGDGWGPENDLSVVARSSGGRTAVYTVPVVTSGAPQSPRDEIIYFTFTDRFADGDPSLNTAPTDERVTDLARYHGGDWAGIQQKIEEGYFKKLGVTTLWISPPNENTLNIEKEAVEPGRYYTSYHGYWPTSFTETNKQFGTMDDLRALVKSAHENDMKVLLDFVSNHVHQDHPLIKENPGLSTSFELPNGKRNLREFDAHPFTTWFDSFLPSLNYADNPEVVQIMTDSAIYWLRETGADGFRHDAVKHVPLSFWRETTRKLRLEKMDNAWGRAYQVGETISGFSTVAEFVGPDLLDGQFDFPVYFSIQGVLAKGNGKMSDLGDTITEARNYYPPSAIMSPLIGNHDVSRFMGFADGDIPDGISEVETGFKNPPKVDSISSYHKLQVAFAFLAALQGPPTLYYGDEIGLTGAGDPDNRRPMIWDDWDENQKETFGIVAELNHARLGSIALRRGDLQVIHADEESLVVARIAPEETMIGVYTRRVTAAPTTVTLPASWGDGIDVQPVISRRLDVTTKDRVINFQGEPHGFALLKLTFRGK